MLADMKQPRDLAHLVLVDNPPHHPAGDFVLEEGRVLPPPTHAIAHLTFSGIGCYRPELFAGITPMTKAKLAPLLTAAMAQGRVSGEHFRGRWEDVGTPQRLADLDQELRHAA
jgi:MurNAc alpha-1-phosphate uridylyltransferase